MGFLSLFKGAKKKEDAELKTSSFFPFFGDVGIVSESGVNVTHETALQASTVLACVDVLAKGLSQVPFSVYRKQDNGNREEAKSHPLYMLLNRSPNPYMSPYDFRYTVAMHLFLTGNAYIFLNRVGGKIVEMFPLHPDSVSVSPDTRRGKFDGWRQIYRVTLPSGEFLELPNNDMWHLRWRPYDAISGLDPVILARECIGLSLAGEKMASAIAANGTTIKGYLSSEGRISDEARELLKSEWSRCFSGSENAGKIPVLSNSLKYVPIQQISATDAQLLDNRKFQIEEICRYFGVQPLMIYHTEGQGSSYGSMEQLLLSHIVHTLMPIYRLVESSANMSLLDEDEFKRGFYLKFSQNDMLRGDMKSMSGFFRENIEHGVLSPNECREMLDMSPIDGGDIRLVPLNMSTIPQMRTEETRREEMAKIEVEQGKLAIEKEKTSLEDSTEATNQNPDPNPSEEDTNNEQDENM